MVNIGFGKFEIESGTAIVSDPTLDFKSPFQAKDLVAKIGIWIAEVIKTNFDNCAELIVYHEDYDSDEIFEEVECELRACSGQVGIYDQEHFFSSDDDWISLNMDNSDDLAGVIEYGVVANPSDCTGNYQLFIKKEDDEIIAIRLVFICEQEEEEDEEDEFTFDEDEEDDDNENENEDF